MITFDAEITKVEIKKTVSSDREFKVIMITDDPAVLQLAAYVNERSVRITAEEV